MNELTPRQEQSQVTKKFLGHLQIAPAGVTREASRVLKAAGITTHAKLDVLMNDTDRLSIISERVREAARRIIEDKARLGRLRFPIGSSKKRSGVHPVTREIQEHGN